VNEFFLLYCSHLCTYINVCTIAQNIQQPLLCPLHPAIAPKGTKTHMIEPTYVTFILYEARQAIFVGNLDICLPSQCIMPTNTDHIIVIRWYTVMCTTFDFN